MEKYIRNFAIYGFFIGLGLAILFVKYKEVIKLDPDTTMTSYVSVFDYVVNVLRSSVVGAIIGGVLGVFIGNKPAPIQEVGNNTELIKDEEVKY